ncbi:hypothetical protein BJY04DRAFT_129843 [Aspergillus karnatakaensis]|uniref:uncharacterized protein n=1 Tax=Aspergillus karnatakaensis TaxID=1810916 RepID=UPI003CCDFC8A
MGRLRDIELNVFLYNRQSRRRSWTRKIVWCLLTYTCLLAIFTRVCFPDFSLLRLELLPLIVHGSPPALFYAFSKTFQTFKKPKGIEIVALVPFHHPRRTEILDCYLQKNLAANGGFLDRIVWIPQSNDTGSLEWLASSARQTSTYTISGTTDSPFNIIAESQDALLVWIDGDVVFIEDHTIPTLVKTKLDHPNSAVVSANVVNQAALEHIHIHSHPPIALPYLPELQPVERINRNNWRVSALPHWKGLAEFQVHRGFSPPSRNHRWLLSDGKKFKNTPIGTSVYSEDGPGMQDWTVKAQQHYSFLHHLELDELSLYKFPIWINPTKSISTAFFSFKASDAMIAEALLQGIDESTGTSKGGHERKDIMIDGKGLVAHYSSDNSLEGLNDTDLLQKYLSYTREMVCPRLT